ncbi:hypothetical protein EMIHUDRAFT_229505 [Emiliania huxleyi CCMP1516]|uniref:Peptidase M14 domain-containing protein n=2 Tax=Emiliania huxleyi TaxID=2903 RepID=A0A0D3KCT8_EMIH1|nr:hypothetical protein EMIHUDRAFT_229505 [Emiliania huxleyi CCMP1516]EOD33573.1 hypothetical protein EMIHUDRAFT_229505 [Emiliania huxleyi CCMP1516]|eukprot:XP_005786002.1 hypothetical protein EMIHUDRAFT_229505 [Emiliania huxleyi CCMP1516]
MDAESKNGSGALLVELNAPWPPAVGLVSRAAGRAVREQPASSAVRFGCTQLEWRRLQQLTRAARVVHSELGEYYADRAVAATLPERGRRLASRPAAPLRGSVGGYLSEEEQAAEFKRLAAAYPSWLAPPETAGDERGGKPAVLYTALLHAREPASLACLLHFLRTLLHSAEEGDPGIRITHHTVQDDHEREDERGGAAQAPVVNNDARKSAEALLFLPSLNPDGWAWNERRLPSFADDQITDGVDLNRNFGFQWGYTQEAGSSGRGCDEESCAAGLHGWGNSLAYPFAHAPLPSAELERYQELSRAMTSLNGYSHGGDWEGVGHTPTGT